MKNLFKKIKRILHMVVHSDEYFTLDGAAARYTEKVFREHRLLEEELKKEKQAHTHQPCGSTSQAD